MKNDIYKEFEDLINSASNLISENIKKEAEDKVKSKNEFDEFIRNKEIKNSKVFEDYKAIFEKLQYGEMDNFKKILICERLIYDIGQTRLVKQHSKFNSDLLLSQQLWEIELDLLDYKTSIQREEDLKVETLELKDDEIKSILKRDQVAILIHFLKRTKLFKPKISDLEIFGAFHKLTGFTGNGLKNSDSDISQQRLKISEIDLKEVLDLIEKVKLNIEKEISYY